MTTRTWLAGVAAAGLIAGLTAGVPAHADDVPATINDIDGDGLLDVVTSSDGAGSDEDDGTLTISYGDGGVQTFQGQQSFGHPLPDPPLNDPQFGRWTQVADLNGDRFADLLVLGRGADSSHSFLFIARGSAKGVKLNRIERVEIPFAADEPDLAVVTEPKPMIVVSSPTAQVDGLASGALYAIPVTASGKARDGALISQNSVGIPGNDEAGDRFGASIAADGDTLVVGAPGETAAGADETGMVHVLRRKGALKRFTGTGFHQNTADVPGSAEDGDHFGASVAIDDGRIAVGVPGEDLGSTADAGMVVHFTDDGTTTTAADAFNQGTSGVPGSNQAGDEFGQSVSFTRPCPDRVAVLVGASEDAFDVNRTTVVLVGSTAGCTNALLDGAAVTARRDAAPGQVDSVIVAEWPGDPFAAPVAVERSHPYTAVVDQWEVGDIDGGLFVVGPLND